MDFHSAVIVDKVYVNGRKLEQRQHILILSIADSDLVLSLTSLVERKRDPLFFTHCFGL
jgi:hypothetical protein